MAITTYTELRSAVSSYLARSDLDALIPDFITLCESRMNTRLRVRDMETSGTVTMSSGSGSLPADYLEWISAMWDGASRDQDLRYVEADSEDWRFRYRPNGDPSMFTIIAGTLKLRPVSTGNVTLYYYKAIPALASNSTNWLLTRAPHVYLYGSLAEAWTYVKKDDLAQRYFALLEGELERLGLDADSAKVAKRPSKPIEFQASAAARSPATGVV